MFTSHLFGSPTVVSCDEELNHFVLHNEEKLFQCNYPGPIRTILGDSSLLVVTGERHRQIRSMFLALVASTGLKPSYLASLDESARSVIASWRGRHHVNFCDEARKVSSFVFPLRRAGEMNSSIYIYMACMRDIYGMRVLPYMHSSRTR